MNGDLPEGWSEERIQELIRHYDNASDQELAIEDDLFATDPAQIGVGQARRWLSVLLRLVQEGGHRVRITRHGTAVAALVPLEDLEFIERMGGREPER